GGGTEAAPESSPSEDCSCRVVGAAPARERSSMLATLGALVLLGAIRRRRAHPSLVRASGV
ncbi:MAG TPA: MYXO-CTERM sorting domain-containing protein, partial [Polyangiaceae bacterium]